MNNSFDVSILHFLNRFAHKSAVFDSYMNFIVSDYFFKGGILMAVLWFFWFHKSTEIENNRKGVIVTLISTFIAIIVGRCLALTLPFRLRPAYNPDLSLVRPYKFGNYFVDHLSSFPSDHAVMFFAAATGIFLISRKAGLITYLYVLLVICLPRMYLGLHYPTDILAGAVVGIAIPLLVSRTRLFVPLTKKIVQFSSYQPGFFYALFFLLSFQISTMFEEVRSIGAYLYAFMGHAK